MSVDPAGEPMGSFVFRPAEDRWTWSDELYAIHGLAPGEVMPTTSLVESHRHPEDRARVREQFEETLRTRQPTGGQHRILDALGGERWVALILRPRDAAGSLWLEGDVLDLTVAHTRSSARVANSMLAAATESRSAIDVAKGALTLAYGIGPDSAFELLRWYSQHTQVRLRTLAERVVSAARVPGGLSAAARLRVDGVLSEAVRAGAPGRVTDRPDPREQPDRPGRTDHPARCALTTEVVRLPGATFVRVCGDVDLVSTPDLADALAAAVAQTEAPAPVVVDLTEVGHLGPTGIDALLACHRRSRAAGTALRLVVRPDGPALPTDDDGPAVFADLASAAA